jgi:hypothetical protein
MYTQRFAARALWACAACVAIDNERVARLVRMGVATTRAVVALRLAGGCVQRAATMWIAVDDPTAAEAGGAEPADGPGGAGFAAAWLGSGVGRERDVQAELLGADGLEVIAGMLHQVRWHACLPARVHCEPRSRHGARIALEHSSLRQGLYGTRVC